MDPLLALLTVLPVVVGFAALLVLVIVLIRYLLAATKAKNAELAELKLRTDLLIADRGSSLDL